MYYTSTRDTNIKLSSTEVIKQGISSDGGLFMPIELAKVDYKKLIGLSYPEIAAAILAPYLTDYNNLTEIARAAYSQANFPDGAAHVKQVTDKISVLELYHGPTSAFKDMALQIMPRLLLKSFEITQEKRRALILVATSGDTGKAALEGCKNLENINALVFYPKDGVSKIQELQMTTQDGANLEVCAVEGNFDDCQTGVKKIFADKNIQEELENAGVFFSSANSINFGRLIPQVIYYYFAYLKMLEQGEIRAGELIDITVPTGNFGNILAAYFAKKMGLPIANLICASNINNILTDFLNTGVYDTRRKFIQTISPSMDILISSNLERLLYLLFGAEKNTKYMRDLKDTGRFELSPDDKIDMIGDFCDEQNTRLTVKKVFEDYKYLIDTHTAVAFNCAEKFPGKNKMLVVSTASAYKFARDVYFSLAGIDCDDSLVKLYELTGVKIPDNLDGLDKKRVRFEKCVEVDKMGDYVRDYLRGL